MEKKKGQYVTRSVYQKLKEENKKLLADLKTICWSGDMDFIKTFDVMDKWNDHFTKQKEMHDMITTFAKAYIKEHPEYDINVIANKKIEK